MNTARYVVGVLILVALPPGVLLWFVIHPFVRFWRRLGAFWSYLLVSPFVICVMLLAFAWRESLLGRDLGTHPWLLAPAAIGFVSGVLVAAIRRRHLTTGILVGLPEISPEKHQVKLITVGIYSRIRHPRYVEVMLFTGAYAFFANYVGVYVASALCIPILYLIVLFEERELHDRFGVEYEKYCRRVPRFVPRRTSD